MLLNVRTPQHPRPTRPGAETQWSATDEAFLLFRHVLGPQAIYRVSKFAKTVLKSSHPDSPWGVRTARSLTMSLRGARAVAPSFQARLDFGHVGLLDVWDSADVVNRPARNSKFVSHEGNDVVTCNGAALCHAGKSRDAGVMLTKAIQFSQPRPGAYRVQAPFRSSHGWIYFISDPIESNRSGKYHTNQPQNPTPSAPGILKSRILQRNIDEVGRAVTNVC
jgi:hypothetical protein